MIDNKGNNANPEEKRINSRLKKIWKWIGLSDKTLWDILEKLLTPLAVVIVAGIINDSLKKQEINASINSQEKQTFEAYLEELKSDLTVVDKTKDSQKIVYVLDDLAIQKIDALTRIYTRYIAPERRSFIILSLYEFGLINHERDEFEDNKIVKKYTLDTRRYFLKNINLNQAFLRQIKLHFCYMDGANLRRANLFNAELIGTGMREADLRNANLEKAYLTGANFEGADLTGANLDEAYFGPFGDIFPNSKDTRATYDWRTKFPKNYKPDPQKWRNTCPSFVSDLIGACQ